MTSAHKSKVRRFPQKYPKYVKNSILSETISKNVDEKPTWLWDILICSFFSLVKGATATTSSRLHHTSFYGDFDIYKVFSSDLSNAVGLHLRLDGFEIWQNV